MAFEDGAQLARQVFVQVVDEGLLVHEILHGVLGGGGDSYPVLHGSALQCYGGCPVESMGPEARVLSGSYWAGRDVPPRSGTPQSAALTSTDTLPRLPIGSISSS